MVNLILKKLMIKEECVLTAIRVLNWHTYRVHYAANFSVRNVFHVIIKCTYPKKKKMKKTKISMSVT
jgi:hypothetical protein